jgi:hypothetical protein
VGTQVVQLSGQDPTISLKEIAVAGRAGGGRTVYVSVLALRGRLRDNTVVQLFHWTSRPRVVGGPPLLVDLITIAPTALD